ncbi:MAG: type II toxin-antitoxin system Phd/YefM family antitoxin [Spirochaetaceae bacterium]
MIVHSITEAKAQLSALVDRAAGGEEVIISKAGKPAAVLVPYSRATDVRRPGRLRGKIRIDDDFDHLPADIAEAFGATQE